MGTEAVLILRSFYFHLKGLPAVRPARRRKSIPGRKPFSDGRGTPRVPIANAWVARAYGMPYDVRLRRKGTGGGAIRGFPAKGKTAALMRRGFYRYMISIWLR